LNIRHDAMSGANCFGPSAVSMVVVCLALVSGCFATSQVYAGPIADPSVEQYLFQRNDQSVVYFELELADSSKERSDGLMGRQSLRARTGMLFDFEEETRIRMWMKNTLISLDMIFLDSDKYIVYIYQGAVPGSLEIIETPRSARFTVELNAGEVEDYGISVGDRLLPQDLSD
jgi:uncharacterized protein